MKKINLEEILNPFIAMDDVDSSAKQAVLEAMKEACRQILELAAENAVCEESQYGDEYNCLVNPQSILDTIKQIE